MKTLSRFVAKFTSLVVAGRHREGRGTERVRGHREGQTPFRGHREGQTPLRRQTPFGGPHPFDPPGPL